MNFDFNPFTITKASLEQVEQAAVSSAKFLPDAVQAHVVGFQEAYFAAVRKNIDIVEGFANQLQALVPTAK